MKTHLLNLRHLEVFFAITRTGSVTEAAKLLHVSQPAISATLKHAEARLGIRLFDRLGGRLRPSAAAQVLAPDVMRLFEQVNGIDRVARDLVGGGRGSLSIAAAFPVSNGYVAQAVASFVAGRDDMSIALHSMGSNEVLERVLSSEVDIGIAHEPVVSDAIDREPLSTLTISCIVNPRHPLANNRVVELAELASHDLISYLPHSVLRPYIDEALAKAGVAPKIRLQVTISSTALQLARHGAGIALVESFLVDSSTPYSDLVAVPLSPPIILETILFTSRTRVRSETMLAFSEHLKSTIKLAGAA